LLKTVVVGCSVAVIQLHQKLKQQDRQLQNG